MSPPTRLGDLLKVVHELHPDAEQLVYLEELLPDVPEVLDVAAYVPRPPRAEPALSAFTPSWTPPPTPSSGHRRGRLRRALAGRRVRVPPVRRRGHPSPSRGGIWWIAVAGLTGLLWSLATTSLILRSLLAAFALVLLGVRPLWRYARGRLLAWRRSSRHRSAATYEELDDDQDGSLGRGNVTLTSARWQSPPAGAPLVRRQQERAVATLLAGRRVPGEIDLAATVEAAAARRPLTTIPQRTVWSTNRGMCLQIDMGPALEPFRYDLGQLREVLAAVASPHAVVELGFDGDPMVITRPRRIVAPHNRLPLADRLPLPGTPVLVVTDLGIAVARSSSPPEPEDFLEHHRMLEHAGCVVRYLVPYPPERWPPRVRDLPILYWRDDLDPTDVLAGMRRRSRSG